MPVLVAMAAFFPWPPCSAAEGDPTGAEVPAVSREEETPPARPGEPTFTIRRFVVEGCFIYPEKDLQERLKMFTGRGKTASDVEAARDSLERFFHDAGYPTVLVNIPEQRVESRMIRLEVIENRIGTVSITGNRWFSSEKIRRDLPSLTPGELLFVPQVQKELTYLNRHPDCKIVPEMLPGKAPESVDVALKVEDRSPFHGSVELNNRATHDTSPLRLSTSLRYDNLWQREHSISAQYQLSPEKPSEVEIVSGSYTLPAPWNRDDRFVLYGVWSNTETSYTDDLNNVGKGFIVGSRAILPLPARGEYGQTLVLGLDYKKFDETVGLAGSDEVKTPVSYLPVSIAYTGSLRDSSGFTQFNTGVVFSFRGAVTDSSQFLDKRYNARGNYIALTAGVERLQQLPAGFAVKAKLDGQLADQPLISNEQYIAGGMESVRGYLESEASGDNAAHGSFEVMGPNLLKPGFEERLFTMTPYLFYDGAAVWTSDPLPGQERVIDLQGTGLGLRGILFRDLDYQVDMAFALRDTSKVAAGDLSCHFRVRYQF